ncbi:MAG: ABC transporter substrate-binding protein [Burkholderiaceae bacterium]
MSTKYRRLLSTLAVATTLAFSVGEAMAAGGTLKIAYDSQPNSLDVQVSTTLFTREVGRTIFETLVTLNGDYQPVPYLAEKIDASADRKTYTFHLRKGVKFHNGKEMTSEDVVASMNRWMEVNHHGRRSFKGSTFEAADKYTVVLKMPQASVDSMHVLASWNSSGIMPKEVIDSADKKGVKEYIGTGPFKFVEWKQDQYIHIAKNPDYQALSTPASGFAGKKEPLVDDIYFYIVSDTATRGAGLQSGQYDIAMRLSTDDYDRYANDPGTGIAKSYLGFLMMNYNKKQGLFADVKMRQAVNAGIDPSKILLGAYASPEFYALNSSYNLKEQADWYTEAGKEYYNQNDPEKAKAMLKDAGYNGEEVTLLTIRMPSLYNAAIIIKDQLENLGMKAKVDAYDFATYAKKRLDAENWSVTIQPFSLNPIPTQYIFLDPKIWGWTDDPELLGMIKTMQESSADEAKKLWPAAQKRSWEYLPISKIGDTYGYSAYNKKKVHGFTTFDQAILWNVSVTGK